MSMALDTEIQATDSAVNVDGLAEFCQDLFYTFTRSDQRKWGEAYVRGLVIVPGRKTVRKISELTAGGGAEQCLQQFVNQSTWDWTAVRRDLARHLVREVRPKGSSRSHPTGSSTASAGWRSSSWVTTSATR
jgi:SRSO17 transposase